MYKQAVQKHMVRFKIRVMFRVRVRVKDRVVVVMEFCIRVQFLLLIPWSGMGRTYSLLAITVTVYILTMTHQTLKHPTLFYSVLMVLVFYIIINFIPELLHSDYGGTIFFLQSLMLLVVVKSSA